MTAHSRKAPGLCRLLRKAFKNKAQSAAKVFAKSATNRPQRQTNVFSGMSVSEPLPRRSREFQKSIRRCPASEPPDKAEKAGTYLSTTSLLSEYQPFSVRPLIASLTTGSVESVPTSPIARSYRPAGISFGSVTRSTTLIISPGGRSGGSSRNCFREGFYRTGHPSFRRRAAEEYFVVPALVR